MIDHVSIGVRDLEKAAAFYEALLALLDYKKLMANQKTVGFGKQHPDFWLNCRPEKNIGDEDNGYHICLRAKDTDIVDRFHAMALELGASSYGKPGYRPEYSEKYYAAFIKDVDQNRIEVVAFVPPA